jgi:hypothetical protein
MPNHQEPITTDEHTFMTTVLSTLGRNLEVLMESEVLLLTVLLYALYCAPVKSLNEKGEQRAIMVVRTLTTAYDIHLNEDRQPKDAFHQALANLLEENPNE